MAMLHLRNLNTIISNTIRVIKATKIKMDFFIQEISCKIFMKRFFRNWLGQLNVTNKFLYHELL